MKRKNGITIDLQRRSLPTLISLGILIVMLSCSKKKVTLQSIKEIYEPGDYVTKESFWEDIRNEPLFPNQQFDVVEIRGQGKEVKYDKNSKVVNQIIGLVNDTANFAWGEFGTPQTDISVCLIRNDTIISIIDVDCIGEINVEPYYKKNKWGALSERGKGNLNNILNEIGFECK